MDNSHNRLRRTIFISASGKGIMKLVKLQSFLRKCCEIQACEFANFVYVFVLRAESQSLSRKFQHTNVVGLSARSTKLCELRRAIFSVFFNNISESHFATADRFRSCRQQNLVCNLNCPIIVATCFGSLNIATTLFSVHIFLICSNGS